MTPELHLVTRCKHNNIQGHWWHPDKKVAIGPGAGNEWCGGGSVVVLDPERVLVLRAQSEMVYSGWIGVPQVEVSVQDVLDALGGSDE